MCSSSVKEQCQTRTKQMHCCLFLVQNNFRFLPIFVCTMQPWTQHSTNSAHSIRLREDWNYFILILFSLQMLVVIAAAAAALPWLLRSVSRDDFNTRSVQPTRPRYSQPTRAVTDQQLNWRREITTLWHYKYLKRRNPSSGSKIWDKI